MNESGERYIGFSFKSENSIDKAILPGKIIAEILISALFAIAIIMGFCAMFDISVTYKLLIPVIAAASAVLCLVWEIGGKNSLIGRGVFIALPVVLGALRIFYLKNGVALAANDILACFGALNRRIYIPFACSCSEMQESVCVTWLFICVSSWVVFLCTYIVRDNNKIAGIMILVLLFGLNAFFGGRLSAAWLLLAAVAVLCISGKAFVELGLPYSRPSAVLCKMFALVLLLSVLAGVVLYTASNPSKYERISIAKAAAAKTEERIYDERYGDASMRAMPMGNIKELGSLKFSGKAMLSIEADEYESLYLRGFVGSVYTSEGWQRFEGQTLYKNVNEFYWLHDSGLCGQNQLAHAAKILDKKAEENSITMKVKNLGADRSVYYTPYELTALTDGSRSLLDNTMLDEGSLPAGGFHGADSYTMESLTYQVKNYPSLVAMLANNKDDNGIAAYRSEESHYNDWVYENYTVLTAKTRKLLADRLGEEALTQGEKHLGYKETKEKILNYLNKEVKYETNIAERSESIDFLENFLEVSKAGYSVHYATAATLMFRYYGIPARYVEGYLITPEAADKADKDGKLIITDNDAHAWVEYYQDGIGWIPFEVTPPYMDVMEQPQYLSSAGTSGSSNSTGSAGQSLEMRQDNYESQEPEKDKTQNDIPWLFIAVIASSIVILVLILLTALHLVRRSRKIRAREASFAAADMRAAVINMFAYIMELHAALGIKVQNESIYQYKSKVAKAIDEAEGQRYVRAAEIYQKAAFSLNDINEAEFKAVRRYKDYLTAIIKKKCKLIKRFKLRWLKGIY